MHYFKLILVLLPLLVLSGCQSTVSSDGSVSISAGSETKKDADLGTLGTESVDLKQLLQSGVWQVIRTDVAAFYENSLYPAVYKSYPVMLQFGSREVVAYADCQKITARYVVEENKKLHFSTPSIRPDLDHAVCQESEYADDAVIAFFENDFIFENASAKRVVFQSEAFDVKVELLH